MTRSSLDELAARYGLGDAYHDYRGELKVFTPATKMALLAAMNVAADSWPAIELSLANTDSGSTSLVPDVQVLRAGEASGIRLHESALYGATAIEWALHLEDGTTLAGRMHTGDLVPWPDQPRWARWMPEQPLPPGYHRLVLRADNGARGESRLIVAPARCYEPPALAEGQRLWGITLQLYTLRSTDNWGMGDFADLLDVIEAAAPLGCALIGLNPLHALLPADPGHISPYSPSSRQFLNVLYIAIPRVPEFAACPSVHEYLQADGKAELAALRSTPNVDYASVAAIKLRCLRVLYERFRSDHLQPGTARASEFRSFVAQGGDALRLHATFDALHAHLRKESPACGGWPSWPEAFRDPRSQACDQFARRHADDIGFYLYLQWLAATQLDEAQQFARQKGMALGLYGDVAVGVNGGGSETWSNPQLYVTNAGIGAPPDPLALKGQDWGIPPQNPRELARQGYQPFIDLLRFNMAHVAALRLDHVMALFRQWWVPRGSIATEGAYVHYPLDDLMSILALESHRHRCLVIGEDLGTVPDAVRFAMHRYGVTHYKVMLFEKEPDGSFKSPAVYERRSLAAVSTHDLPPFRGWWDGIDIEIASRLSLYPDAATRERVLAARDHDRRLFMQALVGAGLWYWHEHEAVPPASHALVRAAHVYLALSTAQLAVVQIEDLAGMREPVNVPGTHIEYPNWQRKVSAAQAEILGREEVREMLHALSIARTGRNPN